MFAQVRMADIIVNDDQSVVITDNYAEQVAVDHVHASCPRAPVCPPILYADTPLALLPYGIRRALFRLRHPTH
eukprot:m.1367966 g.1367966  ORF g.1367966 m.1367966 type:complete len:73 (-) comp24953_c0_seq32:60-278(-)